MATNLGQITSLDGYLEAFGPLLAAQTAATVTPLHTPGRDALPAELGSILQPLYPAQADVAAAMVQALKRQRAVFMAGECGVGKGGLPTTKVLTPDGWTTLGEIQIGDVIIDPMGGTTFVTGVFRRGVMPMYRVTFTDGASTVCSGDHLWLVNTSLRKWRGLPARTMTLDAIVAKGLTQKSGRNLLNFIPLVKPVEHPTRALPIPPYVLGALIGNGGLSRGTVAISLPDAETVERVAAGVALLGVSTKPRSASGIDFRLSTPRGKENRLLNHLRDLGLMGGLAKDKFIPHAYLHADVEQRSALLRGLCDTDGCVANDNGTGVEYCTVSPRLAQDVRALVQSLGGTATIATKVPTYTYNGEKRTGQLAYRLYIALPSSIRPFDLARKLNRCKPRTKYVPTRAIAKVEPYGDAECICISVASSSKLYVTDDYIVTHNTRIGAAAAHAHAAGRPYRAVVMAPDHLVEKWRRELEAVVPDAAVTVFESWRDVLGLCDRRHEPPTRPEWYVLGRDQSKLGAAWEPIAVKRPWRAMMDDGAGGLVSRPVLYWACPACGETVTDRKGEPASWEEIKASGANRPTCRACGGPLWQHFVRLSQAAAKTKARRGGGWCADVLRPAPVPAWREERRPKIAPNRWAPERIIKRRLKGFYDYVIIDEAHETKAQDSGQGNAAGAIAAAAKKTICLTGTILGGYAWHVYAMLWRTNPTWMKSAGFAWGRDMPFTERYGRVEETIVIRGGKGPSGEANVFSRGGANVTRRKAARPGIMPSLFGEMLLPSTIFLALDEISDALPPRPTDEVVAVAADPDVASAYSRLEDEIARVIAPMLAKSDTSLLGRMLHALLSYQDHPFDWQASGYLQPFGMLAPDWLDVDESRVLPKEQALLDLCLSEKAAGRQVWCYVQYTQTRSSVPRLVRLLEAHGLSVGVLDDKVERRKREDWIHRRGAEFDVAISHPMLVQTGLDLFDLSRGVNFATICWFQTGYSLFTLMQASRRAWRIGQPKPCRVVYWYYTGGMQEQAMSLMGQKLAAAEALGGRFSSEGLAAMAGEDGDSEAMALAKALTRRLPPAGRCWSRVAHAQRVVAMPPAPVPTLARTRAAAPAAQLTLF